ncbi:MAG: hypothetical protein WC308_04500 [archaeon]|jgi:hypothetical protein
MKAYFSERGQGTIEYIVILAIIVVIALVVVSIIASFSGSGTQITQNASAQYWISNYPIGVLGAQMNIASAGFEDANWGTESSPRSFGIIIKNNGSEKITITSLSLDGGTAITSANNSGAATDWNTHFLKAGSGGTNGTYLIDLTNRDSAVAPAVTLQIGETAGMSLFDATALTACNPGSTTTMTLSINYTTSNNFSQTLTGTKDLYVNCVAAQGSEYSDIFSPFSTTPA